MPAPVRVTLLSNACLHFASAHVVMNAGLEPFLADVDERSLALIPSIAAQAMRAMPARPAAVLVISPFGAPPILQPGKRSSSKQAFL